MLLNNHKLNLFIYLFIYFLYINISYEVKLVYSIVLVNIRNVYVNYVLLWTYPLSMVNSLIISKYINLKSMLVK